MNYILYLKYTHNNNKEIRIDSFLSTNIDDFNRTQIKKFILENRILVNNKKIKPSYILKNGDNIYIDNNIFINNEDTINIVPQNIPINIIFEDEHLLIINKQPGLVIHPGNGNKDMTLVNGLKYYIDNLPIINSEYHRPGIVHRLDKDTSGLMIVAKTKKAMKLLNKQFVNHSINRIYNAIIWGVPKNDEFSIKYNIHRNPHNKTIMTICENNIKGKKAITHIKIIEKLYYICLIECKLETGRTHQIRTHLKYIGHPIFNDKKYGGDKLMKGTLFPKYKKFINNCFNICNRQALHSKFISFKHPIYNNQIEFDSEIPSDMLEVLDKTREYITN